jgi:hypothetical protein
VGVNKDGAAEAGEKSGELREVSMPNTTEGFFVKGAGELRFRVRRSCSTCC